MGVRRDRAARTGREPKYAFSGLLRCCDCGRPFVMAGKHHYACSSRIYGGTAACRNDAYLPREVIEPGLAAGIKRELAVPEVIEDLQRRVRVKLRSLVPTTPDRRAELVKLEREVENLAEAIATGGLRRSPTLVSSSRPTADISNAGSSARPASLCPVK